MTEQTSDGKQYSAPEELWRFRSRRSPIIIITCSNQMFLQKRCDFFDRPYCLSGQTRYATILSSAAGANKTSFEGVRANKKRG